VGIDKSIAAVKKRSVYVALSQFCEEDDRPRRALLDAGFVVDENRLGRRLKSDELIAAVGGAEGIIAGVEPYNAEVLQSFQRVRCISRCGVGVDAIDLDAAKRLDIAVLNTPDEVAEPVAQLTVGMMLALARHFPDYGVTVRDGAWKRQTGSLLSEWTIGLVGFGRIGKAIERCLRPFQPKLIVSDPGVRAQDLPPGIELLDLDAVLSRADLLSLHVARPASEGPLLSSAQFERMKPGSRIINTSRGYLLDEEALLTALQTGRLSGAALDVYETEPYSGPLAKLPQVLCTPHIGTLTHASRRAMELKAAMNVIDFLEHIPHDGGV
jgi:D-3-phosphoglycerate dehydrogenase / 2-oxoglutarate reductase